MSRLITSLLLLTLTGMAAKAPAAEGPFTGKGRDRGTAVELTVKDARDPSAALREGQAAHFTLRLSDETTGTPINGAFPNMWMVPYQAAGDDEGKRCTAAAAALLTGGFSSPSALDLNIYYVLTLNDDGSIVVVDPHFSFGGSQLLGMVQLDNPGYDWALAAGGNRLFVSVPKSNKVAVVDTVHWKLEQYLDAGANPRRIVATDDWRKVFVATDAGIAAIDAVTLRVAATVKTGAGEHDLVLTPDDTTLIVTNRAGGTTSLIDTRTHAILGDVAVGEDPISVAFSPLSGMAYVASSGGRVTVIDPKRRKAISTMEARAGLTQIRMAPGGRFAFIPNPAEDVVQIVDTASNRVAQTAVITEGPFDVSFTATIAYVRRLRSFAVDMIPLAAIGKKGEGVPVIDFPAGEYPFGKAPRTVAAAGIVPAPDENAVIVANPAAKHIYYYKEGMAAPIGHFSNYGHYAQAVLVLDRSLKPFRGGYATTGMLPAAGEYDVVAFVNSPRTISCFRLTVAADPALAAKKRGMPVTIEHLTSERLVPARGSSKLAFRLVDVATQQPRSALADAMVLIVRAGSTWFTRQPLASADEGRYETDFVPPEPGVYYVYVGVPSIGLKTSNPQFLTLEAR